MEKFVVNIIWDMFSIADYPFMEKKLNNILSNKSNVKIFSNNKIPLESINMEIKKDFNFEGNYIFFWDGRDKDIKSKIDLVKKNNGNVRVIRYDNIPILADVSFISYFPTKKYKDHKNKPLKDIHHLENWIDTFDKRGLKLVYLQYKFQTI